MTCLCGVLAIGCSHISRPEQARIGGQVDPNVFLHQHLETEPLVTVAEAYRAMVMLAEGENADTFESFAAREEYLLQNEVIRPEWKLQRDNAIDRGSVAYMVLQILKIRGGVNFNLYGRMGIADRRYAVRELAYVGIMEDRPPYLFITGPQLVDILGSADDYMAKHGLYSEEPTSVVEQAGAGE